MLDYHHIFVTYQSSQDTDVESHTLYQQHGIEYDFSPQEVRCIKYFQIPRSKNDSGEEFAKISQVFRDPLYEDVWKTWEEVENYLASQDFSIKHSFTSPADQRHYFWEIFYKDLLTHWEISPDDPCRKIQPRFFHIYVFNKEVPIKHISYDEKNEQNIASILDIQVEKIPIIEISTCSALNILDKNKISLTKKEVSAIQKYYERQFVKEKRKEVGISSEPTDIELQMIAQSWSEHCKHKIFGAKITVEEKDSSYEINSIYKTYIQKVSFELQNKGRTELLSLFSDNAGIVQFTASTALCMKVETHNTPTAIAPYKGALTGVCGVQRDILGTGIGAKPIFNIGGLFFGPFDWKQGKSTPSPICPPEEVFDEAMHGIGDAGDRTGIPTLGVNIFFGEEFAYRPILFCGAGGIIPLDEKDSNLSIKKQAQPTNRIIIVGAKTIVTGTDGATVSSQPLQDTPLEQKKIRASRIPGGDPITARCVTEFLLAAKKKNLYTSITDNGAGGISCSVGEMARESGGAKIDLDKLYTDDQQSVSGGGAKIVPWQIFLSESQDRMTVSVNKENLETFRELANDYSVEVWDIGEFTNTKDITIYWGNRCIGHIDLEFLHKGCPQLELQAKILPSKKNIYLNKTDIDIESFSQVFIQVLKSPNIASKYNWLREFDNFILGQTVIRPFDGENGRGRSNASVIRPDPQQSECVAVSFAVHPHMGKVDARSNSFYAVDTSVRNAVSVGANPKQLYALDNFAWPDPIQSKNNPDGKEKLGNLVQSCQALYEICKAYEIPLISGKDSMKNDFIVEDFKVSIPPLVLVSLMGFIPDYQQITTGFAKKSGSLLYIVGETNEHLYSSDLYQTLKIQGGSIPTIQTLSGQMQLYEYVYQGQQCNWFLSCRSIDRGGIIIAIAELLIGGAKGAKIVIPSNMDPYIYCYSETLGRFLLEVDIKYKDDVEKLFKGYSLELIGEVTERDLEITWKGKILLQQSHQQMQSTWEEFSHSGPRENWSVV